MTEKKPVSGTKEWAVASFNCVIGCIHDCKYCYAKARMIRYSRKTPGNWKVEELRKIPKTVKKHTGQVMFPTTHDITPTNLDHCLDYLEKILVAGNDVLVVSKPHLECIKKLCKRFEGYKKQILFRFTIGSSDNQILEMLEPGAPRYGERISSLKYAFDHGFKTSISCEPMLDDHIDRVIKAVYPYVTDAIWLGKMNMAQSRVITNGAKDVLSYIDILEHDMQSDDNIKALYEKYKDDKKIKWKESIKKIVGLKIPDTAGQDK